MMAGVMASCQFKETEWVDLSMTSDSTMFCPTSITYTNLGDGIPANCYLPDGTPAAECNDARKRANGERKTSSTNLTWLVQNIFQYNLQRNLVQIAGTYQSVDENGNPITLSGKIVMPADGKIKRFILTSHYTIGSNQEAPSNAFSLEAVLANLGYAMILPDYLGYGITADHVHPYLCMEVTTTNVVDMFFAARKYLKTQDIRPELSDIMLMGYSQGGATTMAVERLIEMNYQSEVLRRTSPDSYIGIHRVFAGGGPYDVQATYENFVNNDYIGYPVAVPLVVQGMIAGNHLKITMDEMMQPRMAEHLDEWVNSKKYTTAQVNEFIASNITSDILNEIGMDPSSRQVSDLYQAMTSNSIAAYNWTPKAPVYMMHSMDDDVVSYLNATSAKSRWANADITYNFGHYGKHTMCCLRFIFTVRTLLEEEK